MSILQKYHPHCVALTAAMVSSLNVFPAMANTGHATDAHKAAQSPPPPQTQRHSPYHAIGVSGRATNFYQAMWGVDNLSVRRTASGNLIRFSYRVTHAERAKVLGEKEATPHLIDPQRGLMLEIPVMENIGQLRQTGTPVVGQEYWMVFSNKGDVVKAGDRVDVVIGSFHADGLRVE